MALTRSRLKHGSALLAWMTLLLAGCAKGPPISSNKKAIEHALEWLDPLKKPERIENAPNIESLRRELQLFYLERSHRYDWVQLPWEEIVLTGVLLSEDAEFEDEIVGGVDLVP